MTKFEVGDHVKFIGGGGEITKNEERPNDGHLLHVYTSEGQLSKLPSDLPHIEKFESLRRERNEELARLEGEKHVTPQEPDLVTAALVVAPPSGGS